MNYIEQLLAKLDDAEAKAQFNGLVDKHGFIRDYIVDPELRAKTDSISTWAETEWDYDHNMSKREWQQEQEIEQLKVHLETAGNKKMKITELEDLDSFLGDYVKKQGLVTKAEYDAAIKEKETQFGNQLDMIGKLATRVPYLNAKHEKEFGKMFDPDDYIKQATEKGYASNGVDGLDRFYSEYTKDAMTAKQAQELERIKTEAREAGKKEAQAEMIANAGRGSSEVDGSPELSHFQSKIMKLNETQSADKSAAPPDAELGRGVIARFAALRGDAEARAGRVQ